MFDDFEKDSDSAEVRMIKKLRLINFRLLVVFFHYTGGDGRELFLPTGTNTKPDTFAVACTFATCQISFKYISTS